MRNPYVETGAGGLTGGGKDRHPMLTEYGISIEQLVDMMHEVRDNYSAENEKFYEGDDFDVDGDYNIKRFANHVASKFPALNKVFKKPKYGNSNSNDAFQDYLDNEKKKDVIMDEMNLPALRHLRRPDNRALNEFLKALKDGREKYIYHTINSENTNSVLATGLKAQDDGTKHIGTYFHAVDPNEPRTQPRANGEDETFLQKDMIEELLVHGSKPWPNADHGQRAIDTLRIDASKLDPTKFSEDTWDTGHQIGKIVRMNPKTLKGALSILYSGSVPPEAISVHNSNRDDENIGNKQQLSFDKAYLPTDPADHDDLYGYDPDMVGETTYDPEVKSSKRKPIKRKSETDKEFLIRLAAWEARREQIAKERMMQPAVMFDNERGSDKRIKNVKSKVSDERMKSIKGPVQYVKQLQEYIPYIQDSLVKKQYEALLAELMEHDGADQSEAGNALGIVHDPSRSKQIGEDKMNGVGRFT
jgi:hypothetical protein